MQPKKANREEPVNVLLVDQGLSFGGALVVLLSIARNLGPDFRPFLVTAIKGDLDKWIDTTGVPVYSCTPSYTYVDHFRHQARAKKIPFFAPRKLYIYAMSFKGFMLNMKYSWHLYRLIKRNRIKVVHINNSIFVALAAVLAGARCLWHFHGVPTSPPSLWERALKPWIGAYLSISRYVTQAAIEHGYPQNKLVTLHNPVTDPFMEDRPDDSRVAAEIRAKAGVRESDFLVAVFGRIIAWKGQLELARAWVLLADRPDIKLMLVGDATEGFGASYKEQIEELVRKQGLQEQLLMTGFARDVCPYYKAADLVIHSSIEPEPFGLVVVEGMAAGKPVIVSNLGATPELVDPGSDGFIVDPADTEQMAACIRKLADDRELCHQMGERGRRKVQDYFAPARYGEQVAALYRTLLAGKAPE